MRVCVKLTTVRFKTFLSTRRSWRQYYAFVTDVYKYRNKLISVINRFNSLSIQQSVVSIEQHHTIIAYIEKKVQLSRPTYNSTVL
jgi:hypothetical protein